MNLSSSSILRMNDADTLRFVNLYEKEAVLWNTTLEKYKNRDARSAAVHRIAEALNLKDFGPQYVLMKFKNLRSSYCQELKKIAESEKIGEKLYVPKVVWFSKMNSFLRPFVQSRGVQSYGAYGYSDSSCEYSEPSQLDSTLNTNPSASKDSRRSFQIIERGPKRSVETPHTLVSNKIIKTEDCFETEVEINHTFSTEKLEEFAEESQNSAPSRDDIFDNFGRYIASLLRELPRETALRLQQEVTSLVLNAHIYSTVH